MRLAEQTHRFEERNVFAYALVGMSRRVRRLRDFVDRRLVSSEEAAVRPSSYPDTDSAELLAVLGAVSLARQLEALLTSWAEEARSTNESDALPAPVRAPTLRSMLR